MGLATKFAAELEQLNEQAKKSKEPVSAKVDAEIAERLRNGAIASGESESSIIAECLNESLEIVLRRLVKKREDSIHEYNRGASVERQASDAAARKPPLVTKGKRGN